MRYFLILTLLLTLFNAPLFADPTDGGQDNINPVQEAEE